MANTNKEISNFLMVSRKAFEHEFWLEKRAFSRFEAWLDILKTAKFDAGNTTEWIKNKQITYGRGELPCSIRYLQNRWNWGSITKVESFLKALKNKDMVELKKGQGQLVIKVCKYDSYNPLKNDERTVKGQQQGQQKDKYNKERNKEVLSISNDILPDSDESGVEDVFEEEVAAPLPIAKKSTATVNHNECKAAFMEFYKEQFGEAYYFQGKDGKKVNDLITKIKAKIREKNSGQPKEKIDELVLAGFKYFIKKAHQTSDNFTLTNFNLSWLDGNFNSLYLKIKTAEKPTKPKSAFVA